MEERGFPERKFFVVFDKIHCFLIKKSPLASIAQGRVQRVLERNVLLVHNSPMVKPQQSGICSWGSRPFGPSWILWPFQYLSMWHNSKSCTPSNFSDEIPTVHSLNIHVKGKHGAGYPCKCGRTFESPSQRARHVKKCTSCVMDNVFFSFICAQLNFFTF